MDASVCVKLEMENGAIGMKVSIQQQPKESSSYEYQKSMLLKEITPVARPTTAMLPTFHLQQIPNTLFAGIETYAGTPFT
ncbi:hypothetical protein Tco_0278392 [Tanacetum coccineum]